jgi:hypothetical protein
MWLYRSSIEQEENQEKVPGFNHAFDAKMQTAKTWSHKAPPSSKIEKVVRRLTAVCLLNARKAVLICQSIRPPQH